MKIPVTTILNAQTRTNTLDAIQGSTLQDDDKDKDYFCPVEFEKKVEYSSVDLNKWFEKDAQKICSKNKYMGLLKFEAQIIGLESVQNLMFSGYSNND